MWGVLEAENGLLEAPNSAGMLPQKLDRLQGEMVHNCGVFSLELLVGFGEQRREKSLSVLVRKKVKDYG